MSHLTEQISEWRSRCSAAESSAADLEKRLERARLDADAARKQNAADTARIAAQHAEELARLRDELRGLEAAAAALKHGAEMSGEQAQDAITQLQSQLAATKVQHLKETAELRNTFVAHLQHFDKTARQQSSQLSATAAERISELGEAVQNRTSNLAAAVAKCDARVRGLGQRLILERDGLRRELQVCKVPWVLKESFSMYLLCWKVMGLYISVSGCLCRDYSAYHRARGGTGRWQWDVCYTQREGA